MTRTLTTLHRRGHFFESGRWRDGRWWVSDFYAGAVYSITPDGDVTTELAVPHWPSGLGWLPDGSLLVVSMGDRRVLRRAPGGDVSVHADLAEYCEGLANDMVVTADGHAYVGSMGYEWDEARPQKAVLVHISPDGTTALASDEVTFPNGGSILSDGVTLVVADTFGSEALAWTIRPDGTLVDRRIWADLGVAMKIDAGGQIVGLPAAGLDGCAVDPHDRIWMADGVGRRALLIAEGGEIVDEVAAPEGLSVYSCALGGPNGTTLMLCCSPDHLPTPRQAAAESVIVTVEL
ncbi:gluconolactonase [Nocardioides marmoriginsengisoli]|uniref:Gluconolactonase n=1 Tax=Nocardioides marmoriginsengisoli TaxID=661483 RepID=A0A3N0CH04_9ACTN|nr:SMP-30/gluconolactonase/LRE family protein [Nocardioides marmoriginsengisoli]RNL62735.1 gluconolactonase [Nocardioides marmoriginsengisoli]